MKKLSHIDQKVRSFLLQVQKNQVIDAQQHIINHCINTGLVSELQNIDGYRLNEEGYKFIKSTDQKTKDTTP